MDKMLLPINIEVFYTLYKRGEVRIDRDACIFFDQNSEDDNPVVDQAQFLKCFPFFESDDQGIILECEVDRDFFKNAHINIDLLFQSGSWTIKNLSVSPLNPVLRINNIVKIYPLTDRAAQSLPTKIGMEISLQKPVYQHFVKEAFSCYEKNDRLNGASSLLKICGLDKPDCHEVLFNLLNKSFEHKDSRKNPDNSERFILHALVYERHEPFPKTDFGVLYDLCKMLAEKEQRSDYKGSNFYKTLDATKGKLTNANFLDVLKHYENEPQYEKARQKSSFEGTIGKDYLVAAVFTKYKELLRNDNYNPLNMVKEVREIAQKFPEETKAAIFLIGAFFGYKRFYDALYIYRRLRIISPSKITAHDLTLEEKHETDTFTDEVGVHPMIYENAEGTPSTEPQEISRSDEGLSHEIKDDIVPEKVHGELLKDEAHKIDQATQSIPGEALSNGSDQQNENNRQEVGSRSATDNDQAELQMQQEVKPESSNGNLPQHVTSRKSSKRQRKDKGQQENKELHL